MSATAHLPGTGWAAAHRTLTVLLAAAVLLLATGVTLAVLLLTGGTTGASPTAPALPAHDDGCATASVGSPC